MMVCLYVADCNILPMWSIVLQFCCMCCVILAFFAEVDCLICLTSPLDTQENPELIWNDDSREKVSEIVETMTNK